MNNKSKSAKSSAPNVSMRNSQFVGVQFDASAIDAIKAVAEGLLETARGLGRLAYVLNASGVNIETLLKVGDNPRPKRK